jgi:hypothetical protein
LLDLTANKNIVDFYTITKPNTEEYKKWMKIVGLPDAVKKDRIGNKVGWFKSLASPNRLKEHAAWKTRCVASFLLVRLASE